MLNVVIILPNCNVTESYATTFTGKIPDQHVRLKLDGKHQKQIIVIFKILSSLYFEFNISEVH